jgi:hypothetical protein
MTPVTLNLKAFILSAEEIPSRYQDFPHLFSSVEVDYMWETVVVQTRKGSTLRASFIEYLVIGRNGEMYFIDFETYKQYVLNNQAT